ncbi:MAG: peroxidase-related enzyme [Chloroflexi bacterium]|nr:peroxidase-related enzyme [Chloroflexota bacterium]MBP8055010.1 peroxidase-related enzyme [Chloroflexota bacterium]
MADLIITADERIAWLTIKPEEELDPSFRKLFAKARETLGFVPNVFVGYMARPQHFSLWFNHFRELTLGDSQLSRAEREMIAVVVSSLNHCLYCLVSHGADLRLSLEDPILADRITLDYRRAGLDARTRAMLDYAAKITTNPVECDESDIQHLRGFGFNDEAIFDIAEIAAMYNFTNRLASATGMLPNREYHNLGR